METDLLEFKRNIISWYPIKNTDKVLQVGANSQILNELKTKSNSVTLIDNLRESDNLKYDYILILDNIENIEKALQLASKQLTESGKILLLLKNKFGMKYFSGEKFDDLNAFSSLVTSNDNIFSYSKIKDILNNLNLKYKFYYPLPDYDITNVIYTDEYMPNNDSIDARVLTFCDEDELIVFSQRDVYKQIIKQDKNMFPFFANSFFIEISNKENFEDIKYVSYGVTRKKEYRIKTIIEKDFAYKTANSKEAENHISNIARNIEILKKSQINCLDKCENNVIISKYLENAKSYDQILIEEYDKNGLDSTIEKIKEFKIRIIDKLQSKIDDEYETIFEKYNVNISEELKNKLTFTKNGIIDLIFQNCLVKDNEIYSYDQEWYEANVPLEFILYRAIFYFTELKKRQNISIIYDKLNLTEYLEIFEELENKIQKSIIDENIWNLHTKSLKNIGGATNFVENYENIIARQKEHIENLENNVNQYIKGIEDLNKLIEEKDAGLVDYANQLRAISNSLSWKITKPIRKLSNMLHKNSD